MKLYRLLVLCLIFSCKNQTSNTEAKKNSKLDEIERKEISIKNELYHFEANDNERERQDADIFGNYTLDRFNTDQESISLDGISDFVEIYNIPQINPQKEITISTWYKPDSYKGVGQNAIIWKGNKNSEEPYCQYLFSATGNLYPKNAGSFKLGLSIDGKFAHLITKENTWQPDQWYNLTGTYDGLKMKFYINGDLVSQRDINGNLDNYDSSLLIGKTPYKEFYTSGEYDDLRIFDRALSQEEVSILFTEK